MSSDYYLEIWKKLSNIELDKLDRLLFEKNIIGLAKILVEVFKRNHVAIFNKINGYSADEDSIIKGSVHLIQLSNRISYRVSLELGNNDQDMSLEDLAAAQNSYDLASIACMRFSCAITQLKLIASDDDTKVIEESISFFENF